MCIRDRIKDANVRLKPTTESAVIATVPAGAVLESIGKSGNWYQVNLPPDEKGIVISGYIWGELVEVMAEEEKKAETSITFLNFSSPLCPYALGIP